jgi:translation initiation factor 2 beta subunit (eIF-2beta)/eIF-5
MYPYLISKDFRRQKLPSRHPQDHVGNFVEFCWMVTRDRAHVTSFTEIELGVGTNTDIDQRLVIKGRFRVPEIIKVVQKIHSRFLYLGERERLSLSAVIDNLRFYTICALPL